ncbi:MAG: acetyl-CoA carboxylase carboxyltransferase subunit alpha [Acidobacteriota bacterium]
MQFEAPILQLRSRIDELSSSEDSIEHSAEISALQKQLTQISRDIYTNLSPWQTTMVARHAARPYTLDFVSGLFQEFEEVHGDRKFGEDRALVGGFARFEGRSCAVIGHQKGRDTKEKISRNFGMPRPEGYRKALRIMKLAEKFGMPVLTFIDTPGAYPGLGAEERGQAEAIAVNLREMAALRVPIISTITGEGGSGGALALGVGDRVFMLEYAVYSVISPEGCAAILWKDPSAAEEAAKAMKMTAQPLLALGVVDEIVPEPVGGAHTDPGAAAELLRPFLQRGLKEVTKLKPAQLREERYKKFRRMGVYET